MKGEWREEKRGGEGKERERGRRRGRGRVKERKRKRGEGERKREKGSGGRKRGGGGKNQRSLEIMLLGHHTVKKVTKLQCCPAPYLSQFHHLSQPADHPCNSPPSTLKVGVAWGVVKLGQSVVESKCSSMREKF